MVCSGVWGFGFWRLSVVVFLCYLLITHCTCLFDVFYTILFRVVHILDLRLLSLHSFYMDIGHDQFNLVNAFFGYTSHTHVWSSHCYAIL